MVRRFDAKTTGASGRARVYRAGETVDAVSPAGPAPQYRLLELIRSDYEVACLTRARAVAGLLTLSPFWLVTLHRVSHWLWQRGVPLAPAAVRSIGMVLFAADLSPEASIGPGFRIHHSVGIVVGADVVAGADFQLYQNVTLGGRRGKSIGNWWTPRVGDNVTVGAGAVVLGPITIGDNVSVGANAVVIHAVPSNSVVVGNPARLVDREQP